MKKIRVVCIKTSQDTLFLRGSTVTNCEICNEEITKSPSSQNIEGEKHYVCFECALPNLLQNMDKIMAPNEEQIEELKEIVQVRKQEMYN